MKKNDIFTFTAPNGVEVTAIVIGTTGVQEDYFGRQFLNHVCYAQNRLFTYNEWIDIEQKMYGEVIADYAILPDYDEFLQLHSSMEYPLGEQNLEKEIQGIFDREMSTNDTTAEEQKTIDMDDRIDSYLRGQMTKEEELAFIADCQNNKELKERAYITALLAKSLK